MVENRLIIAQFVKYLAVGFLSNGSAYGLYFVMTSFGLDPINSMTIVYVLACVIAFTANKSWTFQSGLTIGTTAPRYISIQIIGYFTNLFLLSGLHYGLGVPHLLAQLVGIIVVAIELFLLSRYYVFR